MNMLAEHYRTASLAKRLMFGITAAVVLNAIYCLAYRYASGSPATLFEAFAWGAINIAPWVAAFEIGRATRRLSVLFGIFLAAMSISLLMEAVLYLSWPTGFDWVRRLPAALLVAVSLGLLGYWESARELDERDTGASSAEAVGRCDWAMSAGNYVEIHSIGTPVQLIRSSLTQFIADSGPGLVRVHRRYAVRLSSTRKVERTHVVLSDGTRVPIGDRYRAKLVGSKSLVPSSQMA